MTIFAGETTKDIMSLPPFLPLDVWREITSRMQDDTCCIYTHDDFVEQVKAISDACCGGEPLLLPLPVATLTNPTQQNIERARMRLDERKAAHGDCKEWHVDGLIRHTGLGDLCAPPLARKICSRIILQKWPSIRKCKAPCGTRSNMWDKILTSEQAAKVRILSTHIAETVIDDENIDVAMLTDRFVLDPRCTSDALRFTLADNAVAQARMIQPLFPTLPNFSKVTRGSTTMPGRVWERACRASRSFVFPPQPTIEVREILEGFLFLGHNNTKEEEEEKWLALASGVRASWTDIMHAEGIPEAFQQFLLQENLANMHACIQGLALLLHENIMPTLLMCGARVVFVLGMQDTHNGVSVCDLPLAWTSSCKWGKPWELSNTTHTMVRKAKRCLDAFRVLREGLAQRGVVSGVRSTSRLCRAFVMSGGKGGAPRAAWVAGVMHAYAFLANHTSYPMYMRAMKRRKYACMTLAIRDCHMKGVAIPGSVMRVWKALHARYASSQKEES